MEFSYKNVLRKHQNASVGQISLDNIIVWIILHINVDNKID